MTVEEFSENFIDVFFVKIYIIIDVITWGLFIYNEELI